MKKLASIFILLFVSAISFAQFPVSTSFRYGSIEDLARSEGIEVSYGGVGSITVTGTLAAVSTDELKYTFVSGGNLNSYNSSYGTTVTHTIRHKFDKHVEGLYYSPSNIGAALFGNYPYGTNTLEANANIAVQRPFYQTLYPGQSFQSAVLNVVYLPNPGGTAPAIGSTTTITINYTSQIWGNLVSDANLFATKTVDLLGDSIGAGIGPTDWRNAPAYLYREYYTDKGYNWRFRNRSASGAITANHLNWMKAGRYYHDYPACIIIQVGTNDASGETTADNIKAMINKFLAMYTKLPDNYVRIIVPAILPKSDANAESLAATKRSQIKAMIQALPAYNTQVFYIEGTGTAWTVPDDTKYNNSDKVHPTDAATLIYWNIIKTFLDANPKMFSGKP